eukprot:c56270_g1_i1 orf=174-398(+)
MLYKILFLTTEPRYSIVYIAGKFANHQMETEDVFTYSPITNLHLLKGNEHLQDVKILHHEFKSCAIPVGDVREG